MDVMKEIGDKIAEKRKEKGWTQRELAEMLHVSDKNVSKWECGRGVPDVFYLKRLAELFGVDMDFFVESGDVKEVEDTNCAKKTRAGKICCTMLLVLALFPLLAAVIARIFSPETVPCHYDGEWNVTRWGSSKEMTTVGVTYFAIVAIAATALYAVFVKIKNPEVKQGTVWIAFAVFAGMAIAFIGIEVMIFKTNYSLSLEAGYSVGDNSKFGELYSTLICALYATGGAACIFVPKNAFLGVRTSYSFSGKKQWEFVNAIAGIAMYVCSVVMIIITGYIDYPVGTGYMIAATIVPAVTVFASAFVAGFIHKKVRKESKNASGCNETPEERA